MRNGSALQLVFCKPSGRAGERMFDRLVRGVRVRAQRFRHSYLRRGRA